MFKSPPRFYGHKSIVEDGNFVLYDKILNKTGDDISLFHRHCPHRMYPMHKVGEHVKNIFCDFHGFEWDQTGKPLNNNRNIHCGKLNVGKSGLLFKNFQEPNHKWVDDLASEKNLKYSHSRFGTSKGSWLWMMEIQADLLHIRRGEKAVHPSLSEITELDDTDLFEGENWILQTCSTGWWLFVYPYTFVEYSKGCVAVNFTTPHDENNEFGFDWITQFYFDESVDQAKRDEFEFYIEPVFIEDVKAIEKQKGPWFPIINPHNRLENHCVHYGEWVRKNKNAGI